MDTDIPALLQTFLFSLPTVTVSTPSVSAVIAFVLALVLLLFSAFASGSEIAFFSLSRENMDELSDSDSTRDKLILKLISEPDRLLATILIVNDFVNVGIVMLLNYFFLSIFDFGMDAEWLEFLLLTVVLTVLTWL